MSTEAQLADQREPTSPAKAVWSYLALAFGLSWIAWLIVIMFHAREEFLTIGVAGPAIAAMILAGNSRRDERSNSNVRAAIFVVTMVASWIVINLYYAWRGDSALTFQPRPELMVCAVFPAWIVSEVSSPDAGVRALLLRLVRPPDRWSLAAFLFFPVLLLVPAWIAHIFHQRLIMPAGHRPIAASIAVALSVFLYNLLFAAVLEEPGWRGFLLDRLQTRVSPLLASLFVWLPWALWHLPLDYSRPGHFSIAMYLQVRVIFLIPIVILLTWLYNRSARSIQATAIFHAGMNTFPFVLPYYMPGFALLFLLAAIAIFADRMWSKPARESAVN
jgi:membrane protease YdiL (CAAX protease family)